MEPGSPLLERFTQHLDAGLRPQAAQDPSLSETLTRMLGEAQQAWPAIDLEAGHFFAYVAERLPKDAALLDSLAAVRVPDLYLACACAAGDPTAIALFESTFIADIDASLASMRLPPASLEEVKQLIRQRLLVPAAGTEAKIGGFAGRSGLKRWVRAVAVRTCLNFMRKGKREILVENEDVFAGVSAEQDDPEIAYMKRRYRNEFQAAFQLALSALDDREQTLLRYHYVDALSIDEIGSIHRVHRVTAYRWLERARTRLVELTLATLRGQLNVDEPEFASIMRMIRSQIHLSLHRVLGEDET